MPKPTKNQTPKKPVVVPTLVDVALKRRWGALSKVISSATHEEATDFDRKWEAVADIVFATPPLYLAGGFSTDKAFFEQYLKVDRSTGLRKARVARLATAADIEKYGDTKIDAVLDFLEAKTGGPVKSRLPIALPAVRIPVGSKGEVHQVSLDDASREQIRAATRVLKQTHGQATKASPQGTAIAKALAAAGFRSIDVVVHRDGFDLRGITFDALAKLAKALAGVKLPPPLKPQ